MRQVDTSNKGMIVVDTSRSPFRSDGVYSYPVTIIDHGSGYLLCCRSFPDVKAQDAHRDLRRLFRTHGLNRLTVG